MTVKCLVFRRDEGIFCVRRQFVGAYGYAAVFNCRTLYLVACVVKKVYALTIVYKLCPVKLCIGCDGKICRNLSSFASAVTAKYAAIAASAAAIMQSSTASDIFKLFFIKFSMYKNIK